MPATIDGRNMSSGDFELTAGWGHFGAGQAVMPGQGRVVQRPYTRTERDALLTPSPLEGEGPGEESLLPSRADVQVEGAVSAVGATTRDVHLNDRAYWRSVPAAVWDYKLGGYQALKKWLSYRERAVLGRPLTPDEIVQFTNTARRIGAILLLVAAK